MEHVINEIEDLFAFVNDNIKRNQSVEISKVLNQNIYKIYFDFDYDDINEINFEEEYSYMLGAMESRGWTLELRFDERTKLHILQINV